MKTLLLALLALPLAAQTPITLTRAECSATSSTMLRLVLYTPATVAGRTVTVPLCVDFPDAKLTNVSGVLKIELPKPVTPILRIETASLPLSATPDQTTMDHTLAATPIAGSPILWFLSSGRLVSSRESGAVAASGRTVRIGLPNSRPFTAEDVVTLVYQAQPE